MLAVGFIILLLGSQPLALPGSRGGEKGQLKTRICSSGRENLPWHSVPSRRRIARRNGLLSS